MNVADAATLDLPIMDTEPKEKCCIHAIENAWRQTRLHMQGSCMLSLHTRKHAYRIYKHEQMGKRDEKIKES